jgi:hypothetical protein
MKFTPEDPRLTSYLLGELSSSETLLMEDALARDPALRAELDKLRETQKAMDSRLRPPEEKLRPAQRAHILEIARSLADSKKIVALPPRPETPAYLLPLAVAAILLCGFFVLLKQPRPKTSSTDLARSGTQEIGTPGKPKVAPAEPAPMKVEKLPIALERRSALAKEFSTLKLPIHCGRTSYDRVTQAIRERRLPTPESIRLEEILNRFSYRFGGMTSIARSSNAPWHPDARDSGVSAYNATLTSELIACPWKPSSTLLLISLRGNGKNPIEAKLAYQANPDCVASYRLLGFIPVSGQAPEALPSTLARDEMTTLVMEIESSNSGTELGLLQWSTEGKTAPAIPLTCKADAEPSDDARFAALVCTYSQWLAGEQATLIDADLVAALARETASSTLAPEREDFLSLVDQSLHLAERK